MEPQFPGNSKRPTRPRDEPKEVKRVVSGEVVRRKTPLGRRMTQNLIGGDAQSVWGYVVGEVLVPAARDMIEDAFIGGITRMIRGEDARPARSRSRSGGSHTPYNRYSSSGGRSSRDEPRREVSRRNREIHNFDEIILPTRVEAEEVLDCLEDLIERYETASVADLYGLIGTSSNYTDQKWGWDDLRGAGVSHVRGGYLLNLPKPVPVD